VQIKRPIDFDSPEWAEILAQGAEAMGTHLTPQQIGQFALHAKELMAWNRSANLTAITEPTEVAEKHFLDTLPLVFIVPRHCRVLDIGPGGGIPGIPLKVVRPDVHVTLVDASRKKAHFLKHVIRTLNLKGIEAIQLRAEDLPKEHGTAVGQYTVVISRAAFKLDRLVDLALPLLHKPGQVIAMKGASVADELRSVRHKINSEGLTVNTKAYCLPRLAIERTLVVFSIAP
jgi:16S rRNA (guanine527-N7)-methyltransferase